MKISDLLEAKGTRVEVIRSTDTLGEAVRLLTEHRVGALVVSADGRLVEGIVSERDVVREVAAGGDPLSRLVGDVMTTPVTTCSPSDDVVSLMSVMTENRFRHVPVVEGGQMVGIVSIGDVVKFRVDELERDRRELLEYVSAR
jgi:CBS domain-containing protein